MCKNICTEENIADVLTRAANVGTLQYHVDTDGGECRRDRHWIAPEVAERDIVQSRCEDSTEQEPWLEPEVTAGKH